jgi:hypothetical protein
MNAKQVADVRAMLGIAPPVPSALGTGVVTRIAPLATIAPVAVVAGEVAAVATDAASAVPRISAPTQWRSYVTQARVYLGPTTLTVDEIQQLVQSMLLRFSAFDGTTTDYPLAMLAAWGSFGIATSPGDSASYGAQVLLDYPIIGRGQGERVQIVADAAFTPVATTARIVLGGLFFDPGSTSDGFAPRPMMGPSVCG